MFVVLHELSNQKNHQEGYSGKNKNIRHPSSFLKVGMITDHNSSNRVTSGQLPALSIGGLAL